MKELWQSITDTSRKTSELLEDNTLPCGISIDDKVLVIGPGVLPDQVDKGLGLPMDPSVIMLSSYLSQGEGSLVIFDEPVGVGKSLHNWHRVKDCLDHLQEAGAALAPYTFREGDFLDSSALEGSFDIINDHLTWEWIMLFGHHEDPYRMMASRYGELLAKGGRVIIHFQYDSLHTDTLLEALVTEGFEIPAIFEGVYDIYEIQDPVILQELTTHLTADWLEEGRFLVPYHRAHGMIVAYWP